MGVAVEGPEYGRVGEKVGGGNHPPYFYSKEFAVYCVT
jgi:hypothetical protein